MQQRQNLVEIAIGDQRLLDQRRAGGCILTVDLHGLLDQIGVLLVAGEPGDDPVRSRHRPINDSAAVLRISARRTARTVGRDPIGLADDDLGDQIGEEKALAEPE